VSETAVTGSLVVVGTGPGKAELVTPATQAALARATDLVGYGPYLERVPSRSGQCRHASDNRVELERARHALSLAAAGRQVVVVSGGDPGVFAMAAAVFEAVETGDPAWRDLDIRVEPGVTAMLAAAAEVGAGDHVVAFARRPGASAGDYGKTSMIGILNVAEPDRPATFDTKTTETLYVTDVSPDGLMAAVGSTNLGQVMIVPILVEEHAKLRPLTILKDNSGQSISGATFVGRDSLVTTSGDNNARLWKK